MSSVQINIDPTYVAGIEERLATFETYYDKMRVERDEMAQELYKANQKIKKLEAQLADLMKLPLLEERIDNR